MDFSLTEDQVAFQDSAREFARREFAPNAARWDDEHHFPVDAIRRAGELGFCALYAPESCGGLGLDRLSSTLVFEELAAACTSTTAYLTIHNMVAWMIGSFARPEIVEAWGPDLTAGRRLGSYCLTEPDAGSDAGNLRTRAERDGGHWVLTGSKAFISGAGSTDLLVVMARTGGPGAAGVSAFAVPADTPGVRIGRQERKMGWNSQPTAAIDFDGVRVPASHMLGDEGRGFTLAMKGLDGGRINIATCSVGTAQAALDAALDHVRERRQFGQALADFQTVQFRLADMATELVAARQMVRLAAWKLDAGSPDASACCAMAKRLATDTGFRIANEALQLFGGYGYLKDHPLERHVRDTRVHQILEGTNEIMRVIIARRLLQDGGAAMLR